MRPLLALAVGCVVASAACASLVGLGNYEVVDEVAPDGGLPPDATPAEDGAPATDGGAARCRCEPPSGWTFVAFAADRVTACPGDLDGRDLVADPIAMGACSCGPCSTTLPGCNTGIVRSLYDQTAAPRCNEPSVIETPALTTCQAREGVLGDHSRIIPPAPSGDAGCTSAGTVDGGVTTTSVRLCATRPGGSSCACEVSAPFAACVQKGGAADCPAGFPNKHAVGTAAVATCPACACTVKDVKCTGTMTYYADQNCDQVRRVTNDSTCTDTDRAPFKSLKWQGTATGACETTPAAVTADVAEPATICCP